MSTHKRFLQRSRGVLPHVLAAAVVFISCEEEPYIPPPSADFLIDHFATDLDGWGVGTSGQALDAALWVDLEGGIVKLDGSDFGSPDGEPNSWMWKAIDLPATASKFSFRTCAHARDGATGSLRVRLVSGSTWHTLLDWEQLTGVEGEYAWINRSADISAYAGKTITFYIQQGDDDIGTHEQRYVDTVTIKY